MHDTCLLHELAPDMAGPVHGGREMGAMSGRVRTGAWAHATQHPYVRTTAAVRLET